MAKPRKPKVEPVVQTTASGEVTIAPDYIDAAYRSAAKEPKKSNFVPLMGVGRDADGNIGVYVITYDAANGTTMDIQFHREGGPSEAVERFKILAGNIFMSVG